LTLQITEQEFRKAFLFHEYNNIASEAIRSFGPKTRQRFLDAVILVEATMPDLTLVFKRYSSLHYAKMNIDLRVPYTVVVQLDNTQIDFLKFNYTHKITIDNLKRSIKNNKKDYILKTGTYKYVDCASNDFMLEQMLSAVSNAVESVKNLFEELTAELLVQLQTKFETESGLKFADLTDLFFDYSAQKFTDYLAEHGFTGMPALKFFPEKSAKNCTAYPYASPLNGWEMSREPDGYGHECGSAVRIDWNTKKLSTFGWSSDD